MKSIGKAVLVGAGILLSSGSSLAATPYPNLYNGGSLWRITIYDDTNSSHSGGWQHEICVSPYSARGTGISGVWRSTTFRSWYGAYYQEGDMVRLIGGFPFYYPYYPGQSHMTCEFIAGRSVATCSNADFMMYYPGPYPMIGAGTFWGNAYMQRIGSCPSFTADNVKETAESVAPRKMSDCTDALTPVAKGLTSLSDYKSKTTASACTATATD